MTVRVLTGDCLDVLRTLPAESVHCCVTSPPYFQLRDYGVAGQIGLEPTPDEYVAKLVEVFREVWRVLRPDATLWLNVGSSYAGSGKGPSGHNGLGSHGVPQETRQGFVGDGRPYGTSRRPPSGYPGGGSSSSDLCDGCAAVLVAIHNAHTDTQHALESAVYEDAPSLAHTGSLDPSPGNSGLVRPSLAEQEDLSTPDPRRAALLEAALARAARESTKQQSLPLPPAECSHCANCGACLSVLRSSGRDARACARKTAGLSEFRSDDGATPGPGTSTDGTTLTDGASDFRNSGRASAWGNCTTTYRQYKPKDLMDMGAWLAEALRADGWYLRSDIVWAKKSCMPESVQDRPTSAWEHVFLLSKQPRYYYDADAVREDVVSFGGGRTQPINLAAIPPGHPTAAHPDKHNDGLANGGGRDQTGRNMRNFWLLGPEPFPSAHFATFPPEIPRRAILAGCPAGGTVLDPFAGAGTTGLVADRLGRNAVLIELNPAYAAMAQQRIASESPMFAEVEGWAAGPPAEPVVVRDKQGALGKRTYTGFNARWDAKEKGIA